MYDYGARMYMPDVGRWGVPDPLSEEFSDWTPYRYGFNNPISFTDPTGMLEDWYQDETTGNYEYWDGSQQIDGKKHLGASATINVNNTDGQQIANVNLNSDGTADYVQDGVSTSISNTTDDAGFASGNLIRAGDWGLSANSWLNGYTGTASAIGSIPFPKSLLKHTPGWLHGGYGVGYVKGKTSLTSISSFASRRIGLGGGLGRAFPAGSLALEALHDGMLINSDAGVLSRYDNNQKNNPLSGFVPEGFHLIRTDNKQNLIRQERQQAIKDSLRKINPALYDMGMSGGF